MATDLTSLTGRLLVDCKFTALKAQDLSIPSSILTWRHLVDLAFGDGNVEADQIFADSRVLAAEATESLDLLTLLNPFTTAINLARVRAVIIKNRSLGLTPLTPAQIRVGGAGGNEWRAWFAADGDKEIVEPGLLGEGGVSIHVAPLDGFQTVDATHKLLKVENLNVANADWQSAHAYTTPTVVRPVTPNGYEYRCSTAGTSGTPEPTWLTGLGGTQTDGNVVWTCVCKNDAIYEIIVIGVSA